MNIVIITDVLPWPLTSGGAQAQFNILDCLRKEHNITLIFTQRECNKECHIRQLQKKWPEVDIEPFYYIRQMLNLQFMYDKIRRAIKLKFKPNDERFIVERTLKPYGIYFTKDLIGFVNKIVEKRRPDIIEVNFFPFMPIINYLPYNTKKIFIHHEIRFVRNERLLQNIELTSYEKKYKEEIKEKEIETLNKYDAVVTLTETDKKILTDNGVKRNIFVSPAAVSTHLSPYKEWNGDISFIGGYNHIPNKEGIEWFLSEVMNFMNDTKTELKIIGSGWPSSYADSNIKLMGFVDNLEEAAAGTIMIVPILTGSGMRMKILEAAAMNVPFVTTSVGVEGLDFENEQSCLIADTPKDFAFALKRLMNDSSLREKLTGNAAKIFEDKYSIPALAKTRDNIYKRLNNIAD